MVEKAFEALLVSLNLNPLDPKAHPKPDFIGSEVHVCGDSPMTHISVTVEGVSRSSPNYYPMLVRWSTLDNWDHAFGSASLLALRLSDIIVINNLAFAMMKATPQVCPSLLHFGSILFTDVKQRL